MTAIDIFKQSLAFYGRLFNKIFWVSLVLNLIPIIFEASKGSESQVSGTSIYDLIVFLIMIYVLLFEMVLIHRFSEHGDDDYASSFLPSLKLLPHYILQSLIIGLACIPLLILGVSVGQLLLPIEEMQNIINSGSLDFRMIVYILPIIWFLYRAPFSQWYLVANDDTPLTAIKNSFKHTKQNITYLKGIGFFVFLLIVNVMFSALIGKMIALGPAISEFLVFSFNVFFAPVVTIYLYRLFIITKPDTKAEDHSSPSGSDDSDTEQ